MTIKQIAEITGKTERSVRLWAKEASEIISHISEIISQAIKTKKPAEFTLEETIAIIRAGGNETLADLLLENARNKPTQPGVDYKLLKTVFNGAALDRFSKIFGSEAKQIIKHLIGFPTEQPPKQIPEQPQYLTKEESAHMLHELRDNLLSEDEKKLIYAIRKRKEEKDYIRQITARKQINLFGGNNDS